MADHVRERLLLSFTAIIAFVTPAAASDWRGRNCDRAQWEPYVDDAGNAIEVRRCKHENDLMKSRQISWIDVRNTNAQPAYIVIEGTDYRGKKESWTFRGLDPGHTLGTSIDSAAPDWTVRLSGAELKPKARAGGPASGACTCTRWDTVGGKRVCFDWQQNNPAVACPTEEQWQSAEERTPAERERMRWHRAHNESLQESCREAAQEGRWVQACDHHGGGVRD